MTNWNLLNIAMNMSDNQWTREKNAYIMVTTTNSNSTVVVYFLLCTLVIARYSKPVKG